MTKREVARVMRLSDKAHAKALERVLRYDAECRTIDKLMHGACEWIRNG